MTTATAGKPVRLQPSDEPYADGIAAATRYQYALHLFGPDNYRTRHWEAQMESESS
jgi:hypothetical protein